MGGQLQADLRWRWAAASQIGTSHQRAGTRKQDAFKVLQLSPQVLCAVVSDGAGSATYGGEGASLVCRALTSKVRDWFHTHIDLPDDEQVLSWIDDLRDRLAKAANNRAVLRRQFAATMVMLVVAHEQVLAMQIGDSALVARSNGEWRALCWPQNGEFASSTYFVTDDPEVHLRAFRLALEHDAFALFSDGLESVALEQATQLPFTRFFDPMIKPIDSATSEGRLVELSSALGRYLNSPSLCERTDDDKTLILLSCR